MIIASDISMQQPASSAPAAPPSPNQVGPTGTEIRDQIRQSIRDAKEMARDARVQARDVNAPARVSPLTGEDVARRFPDDSIPPQAVDISIAFFMTCAVIVIGWPLARALGRRMERGATVPAGLPPAVAEQLQRIEHAVDSMSIEIERISESQRFMAKLQNAPVAERASLKAGERA